MTDDATYRRAVERADGYKAQCKVLEEERDAALADARRLKRLQEMESNVYTSESKVCYYLRNLNELDQLIKLYDIAKAETCQDQNHLNH